MTDIIDFGHEVELVEVPVVRLDPRLFAAAVEKMWAVLDHGYTKDGVKVSLPIAPGRLAFELRAIAKKYSCTDIEVPNFEDIARLPPQSLRQYPGSQRPTDPA